jgi:Mg-chelatase subunit ChlD
MPATSSKVDGNKYLVNVLRCPAMSRQRVAGPDVERLRLVASAIGGRPLEVGHAGPGEQAWTDGTMVFVDPATRPAEQILTVAVQASLLAAQSLDPAIVRQLARRPALARRYLALEGHRALAANEPILPPAVRRLIDRDVATSLTDPEASLARARGRHALDDPPSSFGAIRPRRLLASADRHQPAPDGGRHLRRPSQVGDLPELDETTDDDHGQDVGDLLASLVGGRGLLGRLLQRLLRPTRGSAGAGPAGAHAPTHRGSARPHGRSSVSWSPAERAPAGAVAAFAPRARTYPEWDVRRRAYRDDWCTVRERDPGPADLAPMAVPEGHALRRPLGRLGIGLDRIHRQPQGDDIDLDAAVEARVAALTGSPTDGDVYVDNLRRRRDLAVLILLDVSGSASEPGPAGRTVHEHQRSTAATLATALHDLGDRVALYAFNSHGRTAVHVTRLKRFDERLDGRVAQRLGGLVPAAYTRLGAAIRHGAHLLEDGGGTSRRLLLVLSDGFAYDHGYEGLYGEADARRALGEARRRGLGCLCLSVGAGTAPVALQRVFGTAAYASVPTTEQLPGLVGPLFRAALRSAAAQRRTFQREERTRRQLELERRTA